MRRLALLIFLALAACSTLPPPQKVDGVHPVVHDGKAEKGVGSAIVLIPGALASIELFAPVLDWDVPDSTTMAYRFPGVDGLALNHRIDIVDSGALIANHLNALGVKHVYLIGYSTGGPIALEAARRIEGAKVDVALLSTASDMPAALIASARGAVDVIKALLRADQAGLDEALLENYRTLLYGRRHFTEAQLAEQSRRLAALQRGQITTPPRKMTLAHTSDLMTWSIRDPSSVHGARIGVFHGAEDSVFSEQLTWRFAKRLHAETFRSYQGQGHLLFVTERRIWDDIRDFFGLTPGQ
ncbi:alpha/beta fold hydrolase [Pseudooceanicola onchidii]|uniref:alpha/beta fold hydrolase n=1 Tax=Pseudooceanicola onchidii TaxID=2562279 RepID=UPI0010AAD9AB|nr:alpha/beta hydrolase [Pseudooceanicola onchidii]